MNLDKQCVNKVMQNLGTVLHACSFKGQPSATVTTDWRDWICELARELLLGGKKSLVEQL